MSPRGPHQALDALVAWATPDARKEDLLAGKAEYFARTGEIFDDDRQLEARMAGFLEHYVCDRPSPALGGRTPARAHFEELLRTAGPEAAADARPFTETLRALYLVRRIADGEVGLGELFSGIEYDVTERRHIVGLEVGDVLDARVIPWHGHHHFSGWSCWHPHEAAPLIVAEARRRVAERDRRPPFELADDCAQRSLKVDRYRQIAVEKIYDFAAQRPSSSSR